MAESETLFTFMDGLKPQTKVELKCQELKELSRALTIAEPFIDLCRFKDPKSNAKGGGTDHHHDENKEEGAIHD